MDNPHLATHQRAISNLPCPPSRPRSPSPPIVSPAQRGAVQPLPSRRRSSAHTDALSHRLQTAATSPCEEGIRDDERSPQRFVWWIENDTLARYVLHCLARYHSIISFSKDSPSRYLMHILRLNVTRLHPATCATLATPPPTDLDCSSLSSHDSGLKSSLVDVQSIDGASGVLSEADLASDPKLPAHPHLQRALLTPLSGIASDADAKAERIGSAFGSGTDWRSQAGDRGAVSGERRRDAAMPRTARRPR
ncbi:hypothetical protein EI94DRAFT_1808790 [Lactarius quietus]|nr:hypothetical protein EI94DRAFT_1808790 [Lactarius quietus]